VIGLVAALADDLNGLGIPVRHAITLCNQLRPFIEDQITRHPAELYVSLDKVLPVAVAHRGGGKPGGWDVVTFNSIAEYNAWSAAQDPGAELPPGQRFWRSGHELLIDVSLAFKRAGASLSRHDVWAHPNEQGADD
jgi:hypothetical protein